MLARQLTDEQKEDFVNIFYCLTPIDDLDNPNPWGCPWYFGWDVELKGNSVREMAENFYKSISDEIEKYE